MASNLESACCSAVMVNWCGSSCEIETTRNFIVAKSCASITHTFCGATLSNADTTVTTRPAILDTTRACAFPFSPLTTRRSPARHTTSSRSKVICFKSALTEEIRPPFARPANNSSASSITLPGNGI